MAGAPAQDFTSLADPAQVSFLPEKIPYIKPRLKVAKGDSVKIGSLLFEDKRNSIFRFLSPAGGVVSDIQFGPRRVIEAIVIDRDPNNEAHAQFQSVSTDMLETLDRRVLVGHILNGGLWWVFRQLPFRDLPDPETPPPAIIVGLSDKEPYQPAPNVYLQDRVWGNYPSDDPGTLLYYTKSSAQQNRSWFISGQNLLLLAQLLGQGRYPVERVVSVGGSSAPRPQYFRTRLGVPLAHLVDVKELDRDVRFVVGGLLRGYESDRRGFMGHYETALNLMPQGGRAEFLALFNPGFSKPTYSRSFLSRLNPGKLGYNCNLHGGQRACIACLHCSDVCPVDIMPHMTYKAVITDEVEEFLEHGLLDCVECGLCSYVCPSKIELTRTFIDAKAAYAKEQNE